MGKINAQGDYIIPAYIANCECEELGVQMFIDIYSTNEKDAQREAEKTIAKFKANKFNIQIN